MNSKKFFRIGILIFLLAAGIVGGYFVGHREKRQPKTPSLVYKDKHVAFLFEIYDKIKEDYWEKMSDEQLANLYSLGTEKLTGQSIASKPNDKETLKKMLNKTLEDISDEQKKKEYTVKLADIVLANLQPFGRSRLYTTREETSLKNTVENKNPDVDQYKVLDVPKNATPEEINKTYEQKTTELKKANTPEAKEKLAQINKAHDVLSDADNRKTYDQSGVEPTMEYKLLTPEIFYLRIGKFSPTTIEELMRVTQKVDKGEVLNTLILDLRDNVGGAIDGLPYFLGPFIGNDQYAYQFFHQGEKTDFKTKIGWLPSLIRYKKVVILINENTQSSAEVMASTLKKYNVGVLVGTKTKGWGTVEKVFEIKQQIDPAEKYSAFLAHSLTLREDGQPIEGKGIDPVINIADKNWEKQLLSYFNYPPLALAIKELWLNR